MAKKHNRKHSKIDKLDPAVKSEVESMIRSNDFTYKEIVEYIVQSTGEMISQAAVCRYAQGLCESLESIRFAQETLRAVNDEINRTPDMDTTEGIIRILSHILLTNIQKLSDDDFEDIDPLKLLKQASDLIRASAYKRNLDIKNKDIRFTSHVRQGAFHTCKVGAARDLRSRSERTDTDPQRRALEQDAETAVPCLCFR